MYKRKLSDDISLQELRRMEESGMSRQEIATAAGADVNTIRRYLGPSRTVTKRRITETEAQKMRDLYSRGLSCAAIARQVGTTSMTVRKYVRQEEPAKEEHVPTFLERLEQEVREGKRQTPAAEKPLKIKQQQTVLEGELGVYTLDLVTHEVTVSTLIQETPVTADTLRKAIREMQQVLRQMGGDGQ